MGGGGGVGWAETFVICILLYGTWFTTCLIRSTLYEFAYHRWRIESSGKQALPHLVLPYLRIVPVDVCC